MLEDSRNPRTEGRIYVTPTLVKPEAPPHERVAVNDFIYLEGPKQYRILNIGSTGITVSEPGMEWLLQINVLPEDFDRMYLSNPLNNAIPERKPELTQRPEKPKPKAQTTKADMRQVELFGNNEIPEADDGGTEQPVQPGAGRVKPDQGTIDYVLCEIIPLSGHKADVYFFLRNVAESKRQKNALYGLYGYKYDSVNHPDDNRAIRYNHHATGMMILDAEKNAETTLTWDEVADTLARLIDENKYLSENDLFHVMLENRTNLEA